MADDTIYRQAAIDAFWSLDAELRPSAIDEILNMLNGLPSAPPEQRWISCKEKLPIGGYGDLIVSVHDTSGDTPFDYTSSGWVTTNGEYWIVDNEICNYVVAWMPLPEPYKEAVKK